jgi:Subtilase family
MTNNRPLLAFGPPTVGAIPTQKPGFSPPPRSPSPSRQGQRLTPQFEELARALSERRVQAASATAESDPELVVVFDLAGTVDEFVRAVRRVNGLEFLAEITDEPTEPDDEFYYLDKHGEPADQQVPETLYVIMSNAQAVTELIRLFQLWQADQSVKFPIGLAPLRQVFVLLRAVRRWGPEDRIRETGLLQAWREDTAIIGQSGVARVEIELWFRKDTSRRNSVQYEVEQLVTAAGGNVIRRSTIEGIDYHAILADLPRAQVDAVLQAGPGAIDVLRSESVMFVAPARPMTVPTLDLPLKPVTPPPPGSTPLGPPRVAMLDGLPLANHVSLAERLLIDDPDGYGEKYTVSAQRHGTAIASLICQGDLLANSEPLSTQLYVRPVLEPHEYWADRERVPPDELLVDLVHRCFVRMFEGDGRNRAAAPDVRVVNFSIGDPARVFARQVSPLARLLDWLCHRYNVLIVVSAGNHDVRPKVSSSAIDNLPRLRHEVAMDWYRQTRHFGLLSPAEATNVLTVGAINADAADVETSDVILDLVPADAPALYSATGFGYRRSVKPEVLMPGGRQLFQRPTTAVPGDALAIQPAEQEAVGPGLLVAAPARSGGPNGTAYSYGTSNAAALTSRLAHQVFDILSETATPDEYALPDDEYHPVLVKTLLAHAAMWGTMGHSLRQQLGFEYGSWRRDVTQVLGYGTIDPTHVATGTSGRVLVLGANSIAEGQRNTFRLPLPYALAASTDWRRLTITLGWFSSINPRSRLYRQARLRFSPPDGNLGCDRCEADAYTARMGTLQHEVFEGRRALAFRSGDAAQVHVDCRADAGRLLEPVRYALAVSIEVSTSVQADIHAQVRQSLQTELRARTRITPR